MLNLFQKNSIKHFASKFKMTLMLILIGISLAISIYSIASIFKQNKVLGVELIEQVEQANQKSEITHMLLSIRKMELDTRGYALTNDRKSAESLDEEIPLNAGYLNELKAIKLTVDNPEVGRLIGVLDSLFQKSFVIQRTVRQYCDAGDFEMARKLVNSEPFVELNSNITTTGISINNLLSDHIGESLKLFLSNDKINKDLLIPVLTLAICIILLVSFFLARELAAIQKLNKTLDFFKTRYEAILNNLSEGLVTTNLKGEIVFFNKTAEKITGWKFNEIVNKPLDEVFQVSNEVSRLPIKNILSEVLEFGKPVGYRNSTLLITKNRGEIVLSNNAAPIFDEVGKISGAVLVFRDMTEWKAKDAEIKNQEKQYLELIKNLPFAVYTCDREGYVQLYNKAAAVLWGREPKVGIDRWCGSWKIFNPDGTEMPLEECPMAITLKEARPVYGSQILLQRPDGSIRHILPHPSPMLNTKGEMIGAFNMLIDITDQQEKDKLIISTEEKYKKIIDQASDGVVVFSIDGVIHEFNFAAYKMAGYSMEEFQALKVQDFLFDRKEIADTESLEKIKTGESYLLTRKVKKKDGSPLYIEINVRILSEGRILALVRDITERLAVESALKQSETLYRQIVETAQEGIWWVDKDFKIIYVNNKICQILGYSQEEIIGKRADFFLDEKGKEVAKAAMERRKKGINDRLEITGLTKSGELVYLQTNSAAILNNEGVFIGSMAMFTDITDRKNAEFALQKSEAWFRAMTESSPIGIFFINPEGLIVYCNAADLRMTGLDWNEAMGLKWLKAIHPDDLERVMADWQAAMETGNNYQGNGRYVHKDGSIVHWNCQTVAVIVEGEIIGHLGTVIDVTEQENSESLLQKALERYDILSKATSDTIWDWDIVHNHMHYNDGIRNMLGFHKWESDNSVDWWKKNIHPEEREKIIDLLEECFIKGQQTLQMEYRYLCGNGSYMNILDRAYIIYDQFKKPVRMIGAMQNVSYQKETDLRMGKRILDALEKERVQIGMELHDNVIQLLAAALIYQGMVLEKVSDLKGLTEKLQKSSTYINDAIIDIRKLSHQLAPVAEPNISLRDVMENLINTISSDNLFEVSFYYDLPVNIKLQPDIQTNLYRILQEQLNNIKKHAFASEVEITLALLEKHIQMKIQDNGKGFQSNKEIKGIGLENIKRRTQMFGGIYSCKSAPGKGCVLTVTIPLKFDLEMNN